MSTALVRLHKTPLLHKLPPAMLLFARHEPPESSPSQRWIIWNKYVTVTVYWCLLPVIVIAIFLILNLGLKPFLIWVKSKPQVPRYSSSSGNTFSVWNLSLPQAGPSWCVVPRKKNANKLKAMTCALGDLVTGTSERNQSQPVPPQNNAFCSAFNILEQNCKKLVL